MTMYISGRRYEVTAMANKAINGKSVTLTGTEDGYWFVEFAKGDLHKVYRCGSKEKALSLYSNAK